MSNKLKSVKFSPEVSACRTGRDHPRAGKIDREVFFHCRQIKVRKAI
ncbi:MAG: hypothetical protein NG737_05760 [Omnitrophica bacterium]|nr:hypothetical protein [Candidatus Omnitrophota bacterium]